MTDPGDGRQTTVDPAERATTPTVLIADDHALLADGLATALKARGFGTSVCIPSAAADMARAASSGCDLALLDFHLGDLGRVTPFIPLFVANSCPVVVMSGDGDEDILADCVAAGAAALIPKQSPVDRLVDVLAQVLAGEAILRPHERERLLDSRRRRMQEAETRLAPFRVLSPREQEVLGLLMEGWSAERIARGAGVSMSTVRTQIKAILQKLGVSSQLGAVALARQGGWRPGL